MSDCSSLFRYHMPRTHVQTLQPKNSKTHWSQSETVSLLCLTCYQQMKSNSGRKLQTYVDDKFSISSDVVLSAVISSQWRIQNCPEGVRFLAQKNLMIFFSDHTLRRHSRGDLKRVCFLPFLPSHLTKFNTSLQQYLTKFLCL